MKKQSKKTPQHMIEGCYEQLTDFIASYGGLAPPEFLPQLFDENPELIDAILLRQKVRELVDRNAKRFLREVNQLVQEAS
jgi:hypothetical protein